MKRVRLTQGKHTIVDDDAPPAVFDLAWYYGATNGGYATHKTGDQHLLMHRVVIGAQPGEYVDHINGNRLDNRRQNLRIVTNAQNVRSRHRINRNNTSGFKGVSYTYSYYKGERRELSKPWYAKITYERKQIGLGRYATAEEAASAYDTAAELLFEEFASPNLPPGQRSPEVVKNVIERLRGRI